MAIEFINKDISDKAGWDGFVQLVQDFVSKEASKEELGFADVTLVLTEDPFTGDKLERPAIHVIATVFGGTNCSDQEVEASKQLFNFTVRAWALAGRCIASIFTSEAWMTTVPAVDGLPSVDHVRPKLDPQRVEAMVMMIEHADYGSQMATSIISHQGGQRVLAPWQSKDGSPLGRFARFIPPPFAFEDPRIVEAARLFVRSTDVAGLTRDASARMRT